MVSPSNELSGDSSDLKPTQMSSRIDQIHAVSLQCGCSCVLRLPILAVDIIINV